MSSMGLGDDDQIVRDTEADGTPYNGNGDALGGYYASNKSGRLSGALLRCDWKEIWSQQDKGTISNYITFVIMIIGVVLANVVAPEVRDDDPGLALFCECIQALGLFGFSGGITNQIAIKMLFDRVGGLPGTGVITKQFKEIRQTVAETVLDTFFDAAFLTRYVKDKAAELEDSDFLKNKIGEILGGPEVDVILEKHLTALFAKPEGMMLMMVGMSVESLKPMIRPFVVQLDGEIAPMLQSKFDPNTMVDAVAIRKQVQELMTSKMETLTPQMVKKLVEEMIRKHLGWLVVWGNLFGGLIGLISQLAAGMTG